jgi:hypothetical protein
VLRRRGAVALAAAAATMATLGLYALLFRQHLAAWWVVSALAAAGAMLLLLLGAALALRRAAVPVAATTGEAGDLFDELAPLLRARGVRAVAFPAHPWRFACTLPVSRGSQRFSPGGSERERSPAARSRAARRRLPCSAATPCSPARSGSGAGSLPARRLLRGRPPGRPGSARAGGR